MVELLGSENLELRNRKLKPASAMPDEVPAQPQQQPAVPVPTLVCPGPSRQRDPPIFSGTEEEDVEDWLAEYERVSVINHWDDAAKLNYVSFYLSGVATVWHRNHLRDFPTWAVFKTHVTEVFGRPAVRKLRAEQRLRGRAQQNGETFTSYIEDVVDLCNRVDVAMADSDKIRHILKGIEDDAFQMLLAKNPSTVSELVSLCQSFDELRKQRAATRHSHPQATSISGLAVAPDNSSLLLQIKDFVREEVARQLSLMPLVHDQSNSPLAPALQNIIRDQVAEEVPPSLHQAPTAAPLTYAAVASRPVLQGYSPRRPPIRPPVSPPARPVVQYARADDPWRTEDNRPICFHCGLVGHVARYCRFRVPNVSNNVRPPWVTYAPRQPRRSYSDDYGSAPTSGTPPSSHRSPSPRRRSLSPMHRRRSPVRQEN